MNADTPTLAVNALVGTSTGWTLNDPQLSTLDDDNELSAAPTGWVDLQCSVVLADWRRGSNTPDNFQEPYPGYATIRVHDPNRTLDPANTAGPYYNRLRAGLGIQLVATWQGIDYPQFTGRLWSLDWRNDYATITATDKLTDIAQVTLTAQTAVGSGDTGSTRIARILANANQAVSVQKMNAITGRPMAGSTLAGNALALIADAAVSEWGLLYVAGDGTLRYGPEWWTDIRGQWLEINADNCDALATATMPSIGYGRLRNAIYATALDAALPAVSVADQDSIDANGYNRWARDTNLRDSVDLDWWANVALTWWKTNPAGWPSEVALYPWVSPSIAAELWPRVLVDGLGLQVTIDAEDIDAAPLVVGIGHSVDAVRGWTVTLVCSAHPLAYAIAEWTLDGGSKSLLDYSNVLT